MHRCRRSPLMVLAALGVAAVAACSDQPAPREPGTEPPPPLADQELLGVDPAQVTLTVPWTEGVVSHDAGPEQVRATLTSVDVSPGAGFRRATFTFMPYSTLPAYRVAWDSLGTGCRDRFGASGGRHVLVVTFTPTIPADTLGRPKPAPGSDDGPGGISATQSCRSNNVVSWTVSTPARGAVRVSELREPPRLMVDLRNAPADTAAHASTDSAPATPR